LAGRRLKRQRQEEWWEWAFSAVVEKNESVERVRACERERARCACVREREGKKEKEDALARRDGITYVGNLLRVLSGLIAGRVVQVVDMSALRNAPPSCRPIVTGEDGMG
jgi:hypothetical protein